MEYTAADVKKLREQTGATFADCRNALADAKTWDEATRIVEAKSDKKAEKMIAAGRETKQGGIFSYVHHNHSLGVLLELNCSTDFVARSESFRQLASDLALQIAGADPKYINFEDVPVEIVQPWVKDEAGTVGDLVRKVIAETGENVVLRRFSRFALGEQ